MRKFGSERIAKLMDRMGLKEGEVITHSMVSKSIERAQKKVEENNFGIRKRLLEYDDVMNAQRKAIYKMRKNALFGDRLDIDVDNMFYELCATTVNKMSKSDFQEFELEVIRLLGVTSPVDANEYKSLDQQELVYRVFDSMKLQYQRKSEKLATRAMPQIKHVYETMSDRFKNIVFPLSDGRKELQLIVNLEDAYKTNGKNISKQFEKHIILGIIDNEWKEHLREMDDLRSAVNNATYEQKDPLVVYKLESYDLFKNMLNRVNEEVVELLMNMDIPNEPDLKSTNQEAAQNHYSQGKTNVSNAGSASQFQGSQGYQEAVENSMQQPEKKIPVVADQKINRNDPCPCGSGKKYKQCHGK
jgi:preprotein translocase subunit SecA